MLIPMRRHLVELDCGSFECGRQKQMLPYIKQFTKSDYYRCLLEQDFYNLLKHHQSVYELSANISGLARLAARHLSVTETTDLAELMNGPIRQKLRIIPNDIRSISFPYALPLHRLLF